MSQQNEVKVWKKHDRCWFWMRLRGEKRSYRQYATVIEVTEDGKLARLRTDSKHTVVRQAARLFPPIPRPE